MSGLQSVFTADTLSSGLELQKTSQFEIIDSDDFKKGTNYYEQE